MNIPDLKQMKSMSVETLEELAAEIRRRIISVTEKNGGHLASNLGVVELTIAIHYVFDTPRDKLIFDVGHQCYAHKILTGRSEQFKKIRTADGISGFPKQAESEFDTFDTGHASTALSLAAGLMRARNLSREEYNIVTVVGDGAFSGGEAKEALNDLGTIKGRHVILLNDNDMTISKSVGAFEFCDKTLENMFDSFGIEYAGSVDGHDLGALIDVLKKVSESDRQIAVRVLTQKGKGYLSAENCPDKFHAVSHLEANEFSGEFAAAYGKTLCELADKNGNITAVTAAMTDGTGLKEFARRYPERLFDVGICEEHAVTMSAGLAKGGLKPYVSIYSSFLQRAFDQILNDVCLTKQPVTFAVDHSGFVDGDGETHQGFYDISYLSLMPNMTVCAPESADELARVLRWSENFDAPLALRYPKTLLRHSESKSDGTSHAVAYGKWNVRESAENLIILTAGAFCFNLALEVKRLFAENGVIVTVQNALFLKPLDEAYLDTLDGKTVVTLEDNVISGGFSSAVSNYFSMKNLIIKHLSIAIENPVLKQGTAAQLCEMAGFTPQAVFDKIQNFVNGK